MHAAASCLLLKAHSYYYLYRGLFLFIYLANKHRGRSATFLRRALFFLQPVLLFARSTKIKRNFVFCIHAPFGNRMSSVQPCGSPWCAWPPRWPCNCPLHALLHSLLIPSQTATFPQRGNNRSPELEPVNKIRESDQNDGLTFHPEVRFDSPLR